MKGAAQEAKHTYSILLHLNKAHWYLNLCVYTYIYTYIHTCTVYIYIYVHTPCQFRPPQTDTNQTADAVWYCWYLFVWLRNSSLRHTHTHHETPDKAFDHLRYEAKRLELQHSLSLVWTFTYGPSTSHDWKILKASIFPQSNCGLNHFENL